MRISDWSSDVCSSDLLFGHVLQQRVAVGERKLSGPHLGVEGDLDVDLIVRTVDARRIIDEVCVDAPAARGIFDSARLGDAKVRPFADHPRAKVAAVDAMQELGSASWRARVGQY